MIALIDHFIFGKKLLKLFKNCLESIDNSCWRRIDSLLSGTKTEPAPNESNLDVVLTEIAPESILVDAAVDDAPFEENTSDDNVLAQNENVENPVMDDIPTFDEALEMEVVTVCSPQSEIRRRVSSRLSLQSDELPDYENYESHPVISDIEKF